MEILTDLSTFTDLGIALFIGALVGTERGRHAAPDDEALLGIRTFILIAEAGAICGLLAVQLEAPSVLVAGLLAVVAMVVSSYFISARKEGTAGLTTEVAAVIVFLLGAAVLIVGPELPVALAIVTSLALALKQPLHDGIQRLGQDDVLAGLKLLFATFIVLPILPRTPIDPWGALKPYSLWWLVILIASISLVGYVGVRWLGQNRGSAVTGLFGGLVSSTAVTLAFARRSKEAPLLSKALAAGVLIAWMTMAVRVLIEVAVVNMALLPPLVWPMVGIAVPSAVAAGLAWRSAAKNEEDDADDVQLKNPFSLTGAMKVGAMFAVVLIAVKLAQEYLPASGVYAVAAVAGLTDVDAITLSLAQEAGTGDVAPVAAVRSIILAAFANTFVKLGLVVSMGDRAMTRIVALATLGMIAGAGAALLLTA